MSCHAQNAGNKTTISVNPATFNPGQMVTVTVRIEGSNRNGGLYLTVDTPNDIGRGTFTAGNGTKIDGQGNVVHSGSKGASNGAVTFEVKWQAPNVAGGVIFNAATLMGNANGSSSGDMAAAAVLPVAFGCSGNTYYKDFDGDGVGSAANGIAQSCTKPPNYADKDGDCDENVETTYPGAPELCNTRDDNCNGTVDEGLNVATTWPDNDKDGFGDAKGTSMTGCSDKPRAPNKTDCDDTNARVNTSAMEICNSIDDDCDGRVDEGAEVRCGVGSCARLGPTCDVNQCVPGTPRTETCNGFDDDCDGTVDDGATCDVGLSCQAGTCQGSDGFDSGTSNMPGTDGGASDGGMMRPIRPEDTGCGCHSSPALLVLLALGALATRRRAP